MEGMEKATGGGANQYSVWGSENPAPTLASQGIDTRGSASDPRE